MEHFMRIAFWIFTLSVTLSDCRPSPPNIMPDFNIEFMKKLKCVENGTFYTPESTDEKCYKSDLECIFRELNGTATPECEDPDSRIADGLLTLKIKLQKMTNNPAPSNPAECACEKWPQKSFIEFLDKYESLLLKENEAAATSRS